jgi:hypothetical protein
MRKTTWIYYAIYEIALWYASKNPGIVFNPWYKRLLAQCFPDWVEVKTLQTMESVDRQAAEIADEWKVSSDPVFTEKPSQVEGLTEMRLRAPWIEDDH